VEPTSSSTQTLSSLTDYLAVLRRRLWLVLLVAVLVPALAVYLSTRQAELYESSADVLVTKENFASALSGVPAVYEDPYRYIQTQLEVARAPELARHTLDSAGLQDRPAGALLGSSSVAGKADSDVLIFRVTDPDPATATKLATAYARQYTLYRNDLDTSSIKRALREVSARIAEFESLPDRDSPLYESYSTLISRREQLRTMDALRTASARVIRPAEFAAQVQPQPVRNGVFGLGLGLILGIGLAFLFHALDTRVRSADEVADRLGLNLLGRIPAPRGRGRKKQKLAMLADSHGPMAESFRLIRTNVEFVNLERGASMVMVSSAVQGEGKSTTAANLAVAFASAGKKVVLVDLDLRRPVLEDLFQLGSSPGVTDVVLGYSSLEEALQRIAVSDVAPDWAIESNGRSASTKGSLEVLGAGLPPPAPAEFLLTDALARLLQDLRDRADLVIIDAPPLLHVGDARALMPRVDAVLLVIRLNTIRRQTLTELRRVIDSSPAATLGFVVTGTGEGEQYYGYYHYRQPKKSRAQARAGTGQ
jgi:succinoglycan biosynthesis transport protein ExoP